MSSKSETSKSRLNILVAVVLTILYAAIFLIYPFNTIDPMIGGVSFVYFYSLVIYIFIVITIVAAAKLVWGE